jgi:hypothetical protein
MTATTTIKRMPTVLRLGPYRLFFYSSDGNEPRHVHVQRDASLAKFWLKPIRLDSSQGFQVSELRRIEGMIVVHQRRLAEAWDEYFSK